MSNDRAGDGSPQDAQLSVNDLGPRSVAPDTAEHVKGGDAATVKPKGTGKADFSPFTITKTVDSSSAS